VTNDIATGLRMKFLMMGKNKYFIYVCDNFYHRLKEFSPEIQWRRRRGDLEGMELSRDFISQNRLSTQSKASKSPSGCGYVKLLFRV